MRRGKRTNNRIDRHLAADASVIYQNLVPFQFPVESVKSP